MGLVSSSVHDVYTMYLENQDIQFIYIIIYIVIVIVIYVVIYIYIVYIYINYACA